MAPGEAHAAGGWLTAAEAALIPPMIEASDNQAATTALADVGGPSRVAKFDRSAGLTAVTPSALAFIPGTPWPGWGLTTTMARDEVALVERFAFHNLVLTDKQRAYGLGLMEHVETRQSWGVSGGVPPGATVALKNGWIQFTSPLPHAGTGWQVNSIGWVHGLGRDYVLAVLTSDSPSEPYGIATIQAISRRMFAELR